MEKYRRRRMLIYLVFCSLILILLVFLTIDFGAQILSVISDPNRFRGFLVSYGSLSILIFILFQISTVILAPIPGELLLIAGGYIFGTLFGMIYSIIGIFIGSIIVFFISRVFGFGLIRTLVPQKKLKKFDFLMNSPKYETGMFLLYLIPEIPKDIITYLAGLTPVDPVRFILITTVARLPCVAGSTFIGANLEQRNYLAVIIILIVASIILMIAIFNKEKIITKFNTFLKVNNLTDEETS